MIHNWKDFLVVDKILLWHHWHGCERTTLISYLPFFLQTNILPLPSERAHWPARLYHALDPTWIIYVPIQNLWLPLVKTQTIGPYNTSMAWWPWFRPFALMTWMWKNHPYLLPTSLFADKSSSPLRASTPAHIVLLVAWFGGVWSQVIKNKTYTPKNIRSSASKDCSHREYISSLVLCYVNKGGGGGLSIMKTILRRKKHLRNNSN